MGLTTEIIIFETSEAFRDDPELPYPAFNIALKADGIHGPVYYGKQIESPGNKGFMFLNWDSYEKHKALIDGDSYAALIQALSPSLGGKADIYHVQFSDSTTLALDGPVTEVAVWTLKASEHRAEVVDTLSEISEYKKKVLVFGQTREDENKFVVIGGRQAVEEHSETIKKPEVAAAIEKLQSLADLDHLFYTELLQYRSS